MMIVVPSVADLRCPRHGNTLAKRNGKYGTFYGCPHWPNCDVIGSHSGQDGQFRMTDQAARSARIQAHDAFDLIWKQGWLLRGQAYRWLRLNLGITKKQCHMEHFDTDRCLEVVRICKAATRDEVRAYLNRANKAAYTKAVTA